MKVKNVKFKVKKSDKVMVLAGKDKGKIGVIKRMIINRENFDKTRVIVEDVNKVIDFNKRERTGISEKEASIHISNVAHVDPVDSEPTRVKVVLNGNLKQIVSKRSGKIIR